MQGGNVIISRVGINRVGIFDFSLGGGGAPG